MLNYRFGPGTWEEMLELRRAIKKEREETIYAAEEFKHALFDGAIMVALSLGILSGIFGVVWLIGYAEGWW